MRIRVKDKFATFFDHRLSPMEVEREDDHWQVTLPCFGLYKLQRGARNIITEYIEYNSTGIKVQKTNDQGAIVGSTPFSSFHDGFETIYTIG